MKKKFFFYKKWILIGTLALLIFPMCTISAQGQNLLNNPGFEQDMTSWSTWGGNAITTSTVRTGSKALIHTGVGGFTQTISNGVVVGDSYTLSAWADFPNGNAGNAAALLGVHFLDANDALVNEAIGNFITTTGNFQLNTLKFKVPVGTVKISVYSWLETTLVLDDFSLTNDNILANPSFENGLTGWSSWGGNSITTTRTKSGVNALTQTATGGLTQIISNEIVAGDSYTLSAWTVFPNGNATNDPALIGVQFLDTNDSLINEATTPYIVDSQDFRATTLKFIVPVGTASISVYSWIEASLILDDFSLRKDVEVSGPVLLGTGLSYKPTFVNVTGGGPMPDITDGVVAICDGTGATDVTVILQMYLDSAKVAGKPLLIPATDGFYKISKRLLVNTSVIGIGGMPTIKQTGVVVAGEHNDIYCGLYLEAGMSGWIYNLHIVGSYDGVDKYAHSGSEWAHNIALFGASNVTIMNNILENPQGDHIADEGGLVRNILITNNNLSNAWRCGISVTGITDEWAIMNNSIVYHSQYVNPIDLEPWRASSFVKNLEASYNNIYSPEPALSDGLHFHEAIFMVTGWFDPTPGGNIFSHHNWGEWGAPWTMEVAVDYGSSQWFNVEALNNVEGNTIPTSNPSFPTVPEGLSFTANSQSAFTLNWSPSTAVAGLIGYLVYQDGYLLGTTASPTYPVTSLECDKSYSMTIKAYDTDGNTSEVALLSASPASCGVNLLANPGFEEGLTNWIDWDGNAITTATVRTGVNAVTHTDVGGMGQVVSNGIVVGDSYTLSAWSNFVNGNASIGVQFFGAGEVLINQVDSDLIKDAWGFKLNTLKFTVPEGTVNIVVSFWATTAVILDDFSLTNDVTVPESGLRGGNIGILNKEATQTSLYLNQGSSAQSLTVFPNPTSGKVNILFNQLPENGTYLIVNDMSGKIILQQAIQEKEGLIDLKGKAPGVYFINTNLKTTKAKKVILQ